MRIGRDFEGSGERRSAAGHPPRPRDDGTFALPAREIVALKIALENVSIEALFDDLAEDLKPVRIAIRELVLECRVLEPVRAERVIVALRGWWRTAGFMQAHPDGSGNDAGWNRFVELCLDEFYGGSAR